MKSEIAELNKCSHSLKIEVSNLKLTTGNLINMKTELLSEIKENKTEVLKAFGELKSENSEGHDKINTRLIDLEKKETTLTTVSKTDKKELNTRIDTVETSHKGLKNNII